jgi:hypothetical protein
VVRANLAAKFHPVHAAALQKFVCLAQVSSAAAFIDAGIEGTNRFKKMVGSKLSLRSWIELRNRPSDV